MKRIKYTALFLSALTLLTVTSCSGSKSEIKETETEETAQETVKETVESEATENSVTETSVKTSGEVAESTSGVKVKTSIDDYEPFVTSADPFTPSEGEIYKISYGTGVDYVPSDNNEYVFPYIDRKTIDYWSVYGLVNEKGELLTPGIFAKIFKHDDVYVLVRGEHSEDKYYGDYTFGLINKDGSKYTGCVYQNCYYEDGKVTFYNSNNGVVDLYTYNDDIEIVSTRQLKYDLSNESHGILRFFMEDNKYCMMFGSTCYIFDGNSGKKIAEYPFYGQEIPVETNLIDKKFGYYFDIEVLIDEDCNITNPDDRSVYYHYDKVEDGLYFNGVENNYVDNDLEPIAGLEDYYRVEYIGNGYFLANDNIVTKAGGDILLDLNDLLMCGALGIFDDGSDHYFLIGDNSFYRWSGKHVAILKSELFINEEDLWTESNTSHILEKDGLRVVAKDFSDPLNEQLAKERYAYNLDNDGTSMIWHIAVIDGYVADENFDEYYCSITDKDGNIVFKRFIRNEE